MRGFRKQPKIIHTQSTRLSNGNGNGQSTEKVDPIPYSELPGSVAQLLRNRSPDPANLDNQEVIDFFAEIFEVHPDLRKRISVAPNDTTHGRRLMRAARADRVKRESRLHVAGRRSR